MNENTTSIKTASAETTSTNVSALKVHFNVGELSAFGNTLKDINGDLEVSVTDRNIEVQTSGCIEFFKNIGARELLALAANCLKSQADAHERRRERESEADLKETEARTAKYEAEAKLAQAQLEQLFKSNKKEEEN